VRNIIKRELLNMAKTSVQSVEPMVADLVNGWLKSYGLDYKLEQETLNSEIDNALSEYYSKRGGVGGNRPDTNLFRKINCRKEEQF
jgi:type IIS restriction enzyme M protein